VLGIFLDTETNGLNPFKHYPIEIALKIVDLVTGRIVDHYQAVIQPPKGCWPQSDPESLKVNGFTESEVVLGKPIHTVATDITNQFQRNHIRRGKAVFICQNPSFDRIFFSRLIDPDIQESLHWPYYWLDLASMYWAEGMRSGRGDPKRLPWVAGFSKDKIAAAYNLPPESHPHRAMNGVDHLLLCYQTVVGFTE
jgi:DNA polymerase-3 subunit epsilon/oligoribonuclease